MIFFSNYLSLHSCAICILKKHFTILLYLYGLKENKTPISKSVASSHKNLYTHACFLFHFGYNFRPLNKFFRVSKRMCNLIQPILVSSWHISSYNPLHFYLTWFLCLVIVFNFKILLFTVLLTGLENGQNRQTSKIVSF